MNDQYWLIDQRKAYFVYSICMVSTKPDISLSLIYSFDNNDSED